MYSIYMYEHFWGNKIRDHMISYISSHFHNSLDPKKKSWGRSPGHSSGDPPGSWAKLSRLRRGLSPFAPPFAEVGWNFHWLWQNLKESCDNSAISKQIKALNSRKQVCLNLDDLPLDSTWQRRHLTVQHAARRWSQWSSRVHRPQHPNFGSAALINSNSETPWNTEILRSQPTLKGLGDTQWLFQADLVIFNPEPCIGSRPQAFETCKATIRVLWEQLTGITNSSLWECPSVCPGSV